MTAPDIARTWQEEVRHCLPFFGHRNWIVIADAAYPLQTSAGVQMILADSSVPEALNTVLRAMGDHPHIRPTVYLDTELAALPPQHAIGIERLRRDVAKALAELPLRQLPHEQMIAKLDEAGGKFRVLIIKTKQLLPYTSVFIELECGYWSADAESDLRATMKSAIA